MAVTPEQIALVESSLAVVEPQIDKVASDFYERLFAAAPATQALFRGDPVRQQAVFAVELRAIVAAIRDHEVFVADLSKLGVRHCEYGVRASHYAAAGPILVAALAEVVPEWDDAVAAAWRAAYDLVVETMMGSRTG